MTHAPTEDEKEALSQNLHSRCPAGPFQKQIHPSEARWDPALVACYHPMQIDNHDKTRYGLYREVACGQCIGCRKERSRQWAVRIMHEAQMHRDNCFITLTYAPENLPAYGSLHKPDFQNFMKRLRKRAAPTKIRFFHCGEYGDDLKRPHYHAALFNCRFPDAYLWRVRNGNRVHRSPILESLWTHGFSEIGTLTPQSAAYIARYIFKKVNGNRFRSHYHLQTDKDTGELHYLEPEYITMSRRPGIGAEWFAKFKSEVYPSDSVIIGGRPQKPPSFYDMLLERDDPELHARVKAARQAAFDPSENTCERLATREFCAERRLQQLPRKLDSDEDLQRV